MSRVSIVGTTSWGTTLGIILARKDVETVLLARTKEEASIIKSDNQNKRFVPGIEFPSHLDVTSNPEEAFRQADIALFAVPSRTLRNNVREVGRYIEHSSVVVSATKGLEIGTGNRMSQILEEELPPTLKSSVCALSGPNLSREVVQGKPSSTVIASSNFEAAAKAQEIINSPTFRVYTNDDIIGVEFGGALKNIIALGAGICDGLEVGDNAKAAFMTRGLAEITRLSVAAGANPLTLAGLAGMGDLIATCASTLSRNHFVGEQLAKGRTLAEIRESMDNVAEGVDTTIAAVSLAEKTGVEMPITQATYDVLIKGVPLQQAISELLGRAPTAE
jgi:glycerol-3-phosphate dehydrogenase (NAD(P)+)